MKTLFEPVKLGKIEIGKRLIRSATLEYGGSKDGVISPYLKELYVNLAKGGVELIITGMMGVSYDSCLMPSMAKVYDESFHGNFSDLANAVHSEGAKIIVQIAHCGVKAAVYDKGDCPKGPSEALEVKDHPAIAMTKDEIKAVINDFAQAALKCKDSGADGVQIHCAHGYLLSQFMSPFYNKREDEYGGSIENRARMLFEVYDAVKSAVGEHYPIFVKINYTDLSEPGLTGEECLWVCKELEKKGIDAIEISSGLGRDKFSIPFRKISDESQEGSFAEGALKIASEINTPVISVGGYRTPSVSEDFLNKGNIAALSLCRPLICEPDLFNRWNNGDRSKARCTSCNRCFFTEYLTCNKKPE